MRQRDRQARDRGRLPPLSRSFPAPAGIRPQFSRALVGRSSRFPDRPGERVATDRQPPRLRDTIDGASLLIRHWDTTSVVSPLSNCRPTRYCAQEAGLFVSPCWPGRLHTKVELDAPSISGLDTSRSRRSALQRPSPSRDPGPQARPDRLLHAAAGPGVPSPALRRDAAPEIGAMRRPVRGHGRASRTRRSLGGLRAPVA